VASVRAAGTAGLRRLQDGWPRIVEATLAAAVAWLIAIKLLHHQQAFFAPAAALIVLGVTLGQRLQRAVEIVLGVAVGVLLADAITHALGPRTFAALAVVTVLSLTTAVVLGGGPILAVQSTVSAVYVAVVAAPGGGLSRFTDALVGGAVALVINQLPLHRSPVRIVLDQASEAFDRLSAVLHEAADALAAHDVEAAQKALVRARGADAEVGQFRSAVGIGVEAARLDPVLRRRRQPLLQRYEEVGRQLDYAVRNTRVLARNIVVVARSPSPVPAALPAAIRELASAVQALSTEVTAAAIVSDVDTTQEEAAGEVRKHALAAVRGAGAALSPDAALAVTGIVWQIRSTAVDILRGTGMELSTVLELTDDALGSGA
jgi:hypothetical protein